MENRGFAIRYIKTRESFQAMCPDPLREGEAMAVELRDADMLLLIRGGKPEGIDDDSRLGIKALMLTHTLTERTLSLAKRQAHLRRMGRSASAWLELRPKKRAPRKTAPENAERVAWLRENEAGIAANCARHGWLDEYISLRKDLDPHAKRADIIADWRALLLAERGKTVL